MVTIDVNTGDFQTQRIIVQKSKRTGWAVAAEQKLNLVGIAISRAVKTPALGEVRLLIALQIGIGEYQYRHHLPWEIVGVHVTIAGLLWATVVALALRVARPRAPGPPAL